MTCREWDEAIALVVDGEPGVTGLAEHLEDCAACSQLFQDLREDQAALRATPAVDSAACEVVRNDVLRRVGRHSRTARWYAAAAIAAGLTIVSILVRMPGRPTKPTAEKPQPTIETRAHENAGTNAASAGLKARSRRFPKKRLRAAVPASTELAMDSEWGRILSASPQIDKRPALRGSTSEIAMRIQTSDPDVVILWLKEEIKGGSNE